MKLISCHIENFGKLRDYSADFSDGTNIICEENGWGKSTFAAFVRAMFYGLEGERKRSIEENERKRYKPWQGGVFGGQLVFEIEGRQYRISRIFNDKDANDEFELRDAKTNLPSKDYSKKIGEEIFKINRESFMRTIFFGQNACETAATDDINAKLGNLADNANDLNNFDAATAKLTEIMNALTPNRASGSLSKRKEEIARYERIVQDGQGISDSIDTYHGYLQAEEEAYHALKMQLQEAGEEQTRASRLQAAAAKKSEWERLKRAVSERRKEAQAIRERFPGEVPEPEEIKKKLIVCGEMEKAHERVSLYRITDSEREELSLLTAMFADGIPDAADIDAKIDETAKLRERSHELSAEQMSSAERARLEELAPYFTNEAEGVAAVVGKWNERNNKKTALPSKQAALTALRASLTAQKQRTKKFSPLLAAGIMLVILAVVIAAAVSMPAGAAAAAAGAALLAAGMLKSRRGSEAAQPEISPELENLQRTIEEDIAFISRADDETADYLAAHGRIFEEAAVSAILQEITAESLEYASLKKKAQRAADRARAAELDTLRQSIAAFLRKYGSLSSEARFADDLYALKGNAAKLVSLTDKRSRLEKAQSEYKVYNAEVAAFLEKYKYEPQQDLYSQISDIREGADACLNAEKLKNSAAAELQRFEEENDVSVLCEIQADENLPSLEAINRTILRLTEDMEKAHNTIVGYNKTLQDLQEKYDEWEESRGRLEELKDIQTAEQKKYAYVSSAREKLALAKEAMTAKYADPILKAFVGYYELISGKPADVFHVDANTAVTVDELGRQREVNTLSHGCRDLIGICLRTALVDAMYQEEPPVLIMDDPFVNLDDARLSAAKRFLAGAAERYQIIYFTCSNSRS